MSEIDREGVAKWLASKLPGPTDVTLTPISGGQSNPTWFVDWGPHALVLRKKPGGDILLGAHAIEREYRVLKALAPTDVPVPKALVLEEDPGHIGTAFYVMERLEGRVISDCTLPGIAPADRHEMYLDMARAMARMHAVRPDAVGLESFGKPGNYFERQIKRWSRQYNESDGPRIAALDAMVDWLPKNMPAEDGAVSIAHGDFRMGNMMFHPTEPKVIAVLDWELSTLGHPLADLGFCIMPWLTTPDEYGGILGTPWEDSGIPTMKEFVETYFAHAMPTFALTRFHIAFAFFRFAVIFVGIADRARAGNAASSEAENLAPLAERFARRAAEMAKIGPASLGGTL
jgi:aminoglycoside phosphotransferase (APT) family kinase protein